MENYFFNVLKFFYQKVLEYFYWSGGVWNQQVVVFEMPPGVVEVKKSSFWKKPSLILPFSEEFLLVS